MSEAKSEAQRRRMRRMKPKPVEPLPVTEPVVTPRPAPVMPEPTFLERIGSVKLFKIPAWLVIVSTGLAWAVATFAGVEHVNIAEWAGTDKILTVGEFFGGLVAAISATAAAKAAATKKT